jgi:hypothetical protein
MEDGSLLLANPPDDVVYAGCFPGLTIVCTAEAAVDRPSQLDPRFLKEAVGRTVYLHAMHSVVDWFAYAKWSPVGELLRSLSLSPDDGSRRFARCSVSTTKASFMMTTSS